MSRAERALWWHTPTWQRIHLVPLPLVYQVSDIGNPWKQVLYSKSAHFLFLQQHIVLYLFILLILVYLWYGLIVLLKLYEESQTSLIFIWFWQRIVIVALLWSKLIWTHFVVGCFFLLFPIFLGRFVRRVRRVCPHTDDAPPGHTGD
jgi:hypothetical protein